MSTHHRMTRPPPPRWRGLLARAVSLVVVAAVGFGVYVGVKREEQQSCLNAAFQASLDERSRATDGLVVALTELNASLLPDASPREEADARRAFGAALARVQADRGAARSITQERQEADCG